MVYLVKTGIHAKELLQHAMGHLVVQRNEVYESLVQVKDDQLQFGTLPPTKTGQETILASMEAGALLELPSKWAFDCTSPYVYNSGKRGRTEENMSFTMRFYSDFV